MRRSVTTTLCAIALTSSGCGQLLGADDYGFSGTAGNGSDGASGTGTTACGLGHPDSECERCLASTCCDRDAACRSDPTCASLRACQLDCRGDSECELRCRSDRPGSAFNGAFYALAACEQRGCDASCGRACGPRVAWAGCDRCIDEQCCGVRRAVFSDRATAELYGCRGACLGFTESCDCADAEPAALAAVQGLEQCMGGVCFASCAFNAGGSGDWGCLGSVVEPPRGEVPVITFTFGVFDVFSSTPFSGVALRACGVAGCEGTALATGTTNTLGWSTLEIPTGATPRQSLFAYIEVTETASPPRIVDMLYHTGPTYFDQPRYAPVVSRAAVDVLIGLSGVEPWKSGTGLLGVNVASCSGASGGAVIAIAELPDIHVGYGGNDPGGPYTAFPDHTGGFAAVSNLPPGRYTAVGSVKATGEEFFREPFWVQADRVSYGYWYPRPR